MAYAMQPITKTASFTLDREVHGETCVNLSAAAGMTVTLPASEGKGTEFELFVATTVTSNSYVIQVANATDIMQGVIHLTTDISGTSLPTAGTTDTITMNGSTTGGVKGTWLKLKDVSAGIWKLEGGVVCTGTEATPFSAAVS